MLRKIIHSTHKLLHYFWAMYMASSFLERIIHWDQSLFEKINRGLANPFFDALMPFIRNGANWIPLYVLAFLFVLYKYKMNGLWWALFLVATVAFTDLCGTYIFKHNIERFRPCRDPEFAGHVRLVLNQCAGGYGFISNHAANHFGMAVFFFVTFRRIIGAWVWLSVFWAFSIAFAQVYVGVHYPLDVIAGALLGTGFGLITGHIYSKRTGIAIFEGQPTGSS